MTLTVEAAPAVKFSILGVGALKSSSSDDGKMRLHGVASSTMKDRHGDTIRETAIDDMVRTASNNMTIFLNHSYTIPEDIGGSVESVSKRTDGVDALLGLTILIDETNPRAVQTWKSVQAGRQVGISIGANLPDGGYSRNKDGTYDIHHVELLEASLVGVPANPKSWVEYAVKALNDTRAPEDHSWISLGATCPACGGAKGDPRDGCSNNYHASAITPVVVGEAGPENVIILESHPELPDSAFACVDSTGRHYPHHTASGALNLNLLRNALARIADPGNAQCGKGHLEAHARSAGIGDREKSAEEFVAMSDGELLAFAHTWAADTSTDAPLQEQNFGHEHGHAHSHDHPHGHDDGEMDHSHDHTHIHDHGHEHGPGGDHPHNDAMDHAGHDHAHDHADGDHPHDNDNDASSEPDADADDDQKKKSVIDIHIDTDNSAESGVSVASPDAPTSTPGAEAGLLDEDADGTDALLGDTVTADAPLPVIAGHYSLPAGEMSSLVDSYAHVVKDLMDSRLNVADLTAANKTLSQERDAAIRDRDRVITETGALLTRLAEIPLVRKTSIATAYTDFRARFSGVYDDDFLDMLEKKAHDRTSGDRPQ